MKGRMPRVIVVPSFKPYAKELLYIQSSGTQYIDTDFQPNNNTRVVIDCMPTTNITAQAAVFGVRNSNSGQASLAYGFNFMSSTSARSDYMGSNATISGTYSSGTRVSVDMNKNVCTVNGKTGNTTAKTGQTPYNLFIFNVNNIGTAHSTFWFTGRVYSCQVYDNGTLVRDFIPVLDFNGVACLFDKVEEKMYYNAGTGSFTYAEGEEPAPSPATVTLTGTGNRTYCYATIDGTTLYGAGTYEVMPGDTITFGVYGRSSTYYGRVTIDGTQALNVTNQTTQTYDWTVPDGVKAISINMTYTSSSSQRNGRIVVTTTK